MNNRRGTRRNSPRTGIYVGDPNVADRLGWPVDALAGALAFDWAACDGLTPGTGPTLTETGTVNVCQTTPWTLFDGRPIRCMEFQTGGLYSTTPVDPANDTDDYVLISLAQHIGISAVDTIVTTRIAAGSQGLLSYFSTSGGYKVLLLVDGDTADVSSTGASAASRWSLTVDVGDKSGNNYHYANGDLLDTDPISGVGSIRGANGIGIGCRPNGTVPSVIRVARTMLFYGPNLAATATGPWVANLARFVVPNLA